MKCEVQCHIRELRVVVLVCLAILFIKVTFIRLLFIIIRSLNHECFDEERKEENFQELMRKDVLAR